MLPRSHPFELCLCLFGLFALAIPATASLVDSSFSVTDEGWSVKTYDSTTFAPKWSGNATHHSVGGNPGGYISASDPDGWTTYFAAPSMFLGDVLWAYNGTLAFDRRTNDTALVLPKDVVLISDTLILVYDTNIPGLQWTHSEMAFWNANNWYKLDGELATEDDMKYVLSNLQNLLIRSEHINGPDVGDLDNVVLRGSYIPATSSFVDSFFSLDNEGWSVKTYDSDTFVPKWSDNATYHSVGGNPGGYISASDPDDGWTTYFVAPPIFLGDVLWAYNGALAFDRRTSGTALVLPKDVVLISDTLILVYDTDSPGSQWTHSEIAFWNANNWFKLDGEPATENDMKYVLSHLQLLLIRSEHIDGPDVGDLDNVVLQGSYLDITYVPTVPGAGLFAPALLQNFPNPFNPRTTIRFDLPAAGPVRLAVYDLAGRLVRVLVEGEVHAGSHEAVWDGRDASGRSAPSGSYLARLVAGGKVEGVRLSLVR